MDLLIAGAKDLGIPLTPQHLQIFEIYTQELIKWNQHFNLTAITDKEGIQVRHFLDSLSCLRAINSSNQVRGKHLIDVGTGAGFPGIPLKIFYPGLHLTLLEATAKKVRFLEHMVELLKLENVIILHERAETLGQDAQHRERYDWVVARAVAEMPILAEYLLPLAKVSGRVLAQKGENAPAEVQRGEFAIKTFGGHIRQLIPIGLRGLAETRYLVLIDKVASTPSNYPRRPGMPTKKPVMPQ